MSFSAPRSGGDILKPADIVTHLLIVRPLEFCPDFPTNDYGPTDAVRLDVCDMDAVIDGVSGPPATYRGCLWFNKLLVSGLKMQIGELVLGWMTTGTAKGKQDPPFQLQDATAYPDAVNRAQTWLAANPDFEGRAAVNAPATPAPATQPVATGGGSMPSGLVRGSVQAPPPPGNGNTPNPLDELSPEQLAALKSLGFVPQVS